MKTALVAGLIAAVALVGCKKTEEGGMSGADTFKLTVPTTSTDIKQGETQLVRVLVDRGSGFRQSVKLEVKAPTGLSVVPGSTTIKQGDKSGDVQLKISADKDAPLNVQTITVKATPDTGEPVELDFKVTVTAK